VYAPQLSALLAADAHEPLSIDDLKAIIARGTFPPEFTVKVNSEIENLLDFGPPIRSVSISTQVQDSYNPGRLIPIQLNRPIPPWQHFYTEADFTKFVRQTGHEFVTHEWDEWFKVDGVLVHDPHAQDRRAS
jgi:hypothetical protein